MNRRYLKTVRRALIITAAARKLANSCVNVVLVDDAEIRRLNKHFLRHDAATDVISFPGCERVWGEIAISMDTARRQAAERRVPITHELALLAVHGLLHLDGFDDTTLEHWKRMRKEEFEIMMNLL